MRKIIYCKWCGKKIEHKEGIKKLYCSLYCKRHNNYYDNKEKMKETQSNYRLKNKGKYREMVNLCLIFGTSILPISVKENYAKLRLCKALIKKKKIMQKDKIKLKNLLNKIKKGDTYVAYENCI